jgi:hypothetical protein
MNLSSNAQDALRAVANEQPENRLLRSKKVLIDLENNRDEVTDRVICALRKVLHSVKECETANAEQIAQAGSLLLRLKPLDPRRLRRLKQNGSETDEDGEIVAGTSASQVPRPSYLSWDSLRETFTTVLGSALWRQITLGEVEISSSQRTAVLEAVLDHVNSQTVLGLISELNQPNESGWSLAHSFPALVRICKEWLAAHGQPQPEPVITKSFSDRLFEELNARGCQLKAGE